jgi:hypothetical protein
VGINASWIEAALVVLSGQANDAHFRGVSVASVETT